MKLTLALISAVVLLAALVGIGILEAAHDSSSEDGFLGGECSYFNTSRDPACDPPTAATTAYLTYVGTFRKIPASVASELDLVEGVEVSTIDDLLDPIAEAGLRAASGRRTVNGVTYPTGGDVITAVDGRKVTSARELLKLIDAKRPGDTVSITYSRDGSRLSDTVQVELGG